MTNRDELDGKKDQVKGKVKQAWGDLTDNERLREEGAADEAAGEVQEGFGKARRKVGEAIEDIGDEIKREHLEGVFTRCAPLDSWRTVELADPNSAVRLFHLLASQNQLLLYLQGSGRPWDNLSRATTSRKATPLDPPGKMGLRNEP